jgi:hypothetical protein
MVFQSPALKYVSCVAMFSLIRAELEREQYLAAVLRDFLFEIAY